MCHDVVNRVLTKCNFWQRAIPVLNCKAYLYLFILFDQRHQACPAYLTTRALCFRNTCQYDRSGEINIGSPTIPSVWSSTNSYTLKHRKHSNTKITCHTITKYLAWKNMSPCKAPITFAFDLPSCPRPKRVWPPYLVNAATRLRNGEHYLQSPW